jgi:hypothetical protein
MTAPTDGLRECRIERCGRPAHGKGLCRPHYMRQWRYGDPLAGGPLRPSGLTPGELFWSKVDKTDGCWLWLGSLTSAGYGDLRRKGVHLYAHKVAYEEVNPPVPAGMHLDHLVTCPKHCVRPDHLRVTTPKQNGENRGRLNKNNTSGVRGVSWHSDVNKWVGWVSHNKKSHYVGVFADLGEAEAAVIKKRNELFTHNDVDRRVS